jgi:hypothetical protein
MTVQVDQAGETDDATPAKEEEMTQPQHTKIGWLNRLLTSRLLDFVLATRRGAKVTITAGKAGEYAERIAKEIVAEHTLVAARMTWNLSFQGFLFAAFALAIGRQATNNPDPRLEIFLGALPVAGLVTAALTFVGVLAAFTQINGLKRAWFANEAELKAVGPRPFSHWFGGFMGRLPSVGITGILIWCWYQFP